jgi:hypothetical protein
MYSYFKYTKIKQKADFDNPPSFSEGSWSKYSNIIRHTLANEHPAALKTSAGQFYSNNKYLLFE